MAFLEVQFPPNIAMGAVGGPGYSTAVVQLRSGFEQRTAQWQFARGSWDVGQVVQPLTAFKSVVSFFRAVGGKRDGFRFKDWTDFGDDGAGLLIGGANATPGLADGVTTIYQLAKNYTAGANTDQRLIRKPVAGSVVVYVGGTPTGVSLDTTTGLATFGAAPANNAVLTWTGQFDVPARFDTDEIKTNVVDRAGAGGDLLVHWPSIPIVEIRT